MIGYEANKRLCAKSPCNTIAKDRSFRALFTAIFWITVIEGVLTVSAYFFTIDIVSQFGTTLLKIPFDFVGLGYPPTSVTLFGMDGVIVGFVVFGLLFIFEMIILFYYTGITSVWNLLRLVPLIPYILIWTQTLPVHIVIPPLVLDALVWVAFLFSIPIALIIVFWYWVIVQIRVGVEETVNLGIRTVQQTTRAVTQGVETVWKWINPPKDVKENG